MWLVFSLFVLSVPDDVKKALNVRSRSRSTLVSVAVVSTPRLSLHNHLMRLDFALLGFLFVFLCRCQQHAQRSRTREQHIGVVRRRVACLPTGQFITEPLSWIYSGGGCVRRVRGRVPDVDTVTRRPSVSTGRPSRSITTTTKTTSTCWAPLRINWRPSDSAGTRSTRPPKPR